MSKRIVLVAVLAALVAAPACAQPQEAEEEGGGTLTIYSGREEELVGPIIDRFEEDSGIDVEVRYGDTAELAAQIIEEGENSPADVFFAQDAGALGLVEGDGRFAKLPSDTLRKLPAQYRSRDGFWVGTSGRVRVLAYNTGEVSEDDLPDSVLGLTDEEWEGRIGWAPTNGSFQAFVTALRKVEGEDTAREWLEGMKENDAQTYDGNSAIVLAVSTGEIDAGLVNHYYVLEMGAEDQELAEKVANFYFPNGDVGSFANVAGAGIIEGTDNADNAREFVDFMLSRTAKDYFDEEVYEYPLGTDLEGPEGARPFDEIEQPDIDLSDLEDLSGTLDLLRETDVL